MGIARMVSIFSISIPGQRKSPACPAAVWRIRYDTVRALAYRHLRVGPPIGSAKAQLR